MKWRLLDLVLVLAMVRELGGDVKALQAAARRVRPRLVMSQQPIASKLMRHPKLDVWLAEMMDWYIDSHKDNLTAEFDGSAFEYSGGTDEQGVRNKIPGNAA